MNLYVHVLLTAAVVGLGTSVHASAPDPLDEPALVVGKHVVSVYLAGKYYHRAIDGVDGGSLADRQALWRRQFAAEQAVIAQALEQGFGQRPDVIEAVDQMEHYMLTKPDGPYYSRLLRTKTPVASEIRAAYEASQYSFDLIVLTANSTTPLNLVLAKFGAGSETSFSDETLRSYCDMYHVDYWRGRAAWPFGSLLGSANLIATAPIGRPVLTGTDASGEQAVIVAGKTRMHVVEATPLPSFAKLVTAFETEIAIDEHRRAILKAMNFVFHRDVASMAIATWHVDSRGFLERTTERLGDNILFEYGDASRRALVSVENFRVHFNHRFLRTVPKSNEMLAQSAADMVIEQADDRAARGLALDQDKRFVQDRSGFLWYQVLDRYQREHIIPNVHISPEAIEDYYRLHQDQFMVTDALEGESYTFRTMDDAARWVADGTADPVATKEFRLKVTDESPQRQALFQEMRGLIPGARSRPFGEDGLPTVFVKHADIRQPLERAVALRMIERTLVEGEVIRREEKLASDVEGSERYEDHLERAM